MLPPGGSLPLWEGALQFQPASAGPWPAAEVPEVSPGSVGRPMSLLEAFVSALPTLDAVPVLIRD